MNRGYVKLWRKSLDNCWLQNHELWAFWCWCLLKASHKQIKIKVGFQEITLDLGQFIFGRRNAAEELGMSEWKIRACIAFLIKSGNLTIKTTNKFSIISIVNWNTYQTESIEVRQQNRQQPANNPPQTRMKRIKEKTTPEISAEISTLIEKILPSPEGQNLWFKTIEAISSTRKSNQVSPSVILGFLQKLERYPENQVIAGFKTYLEKGYAREGKGEKYLLGIIRNHKPPEDPGPGYPLTGSLLDKYPLGAVQ